MLESLSCAVPMLAITIANDHPCVAVRVGCSDSNGVLPLKRDTVTRLCAAIDLVLCHPYYMQNVPRLQQAIAASGGVARAKCIVKPVL